MYHIRVETLGENFPDGFDPNIHKNEQHVFGAVAVRMR